MELNMISCNYECSSNFAVVNVDGPRGQLLGDVEDSAAQAALSSIFSLTVLLQHNCVLTPLLQQNGFQGIAVAGAVCGCS